MIKSPRNSNRRNYVPHERSQRGGRNLLRQESQVNLREKRRCFRRSRPKRRASGAGLSEESSGRTPVADPDDLPDVPEPYDMEPFHETDSDAAEGSFLILNV